MTWTDTIFHSGIFLTFGPRLVLHQEGEMSVSSQSRHKQTIYGFRRWSPRTTLLCCMSQLFGTQETRQPRRRRVRLLSYVPCQAQVVPQPVLTTSSLEVVDAMIVQR
jgi:hypothetical protein